MARRRPLKLRIKYQMTPLVQASGQLGQVPGPDRETEA